MDCNVKLLWIDEMLHRHFPRAVLSLEQGLTIVYSFIRPSIHPSIHSFILSYRWARRHDRCVVWLNHVCTVWELEWCWAHDLADH